jgi:hypothetical protein
MNTRKLTLLFTALIGLAVSAFAQSIQTQATVARVTGAATVTLPDGSTTPLSAGMKVAQGSTITTGGDGDVYLESHAGYVTSIKKDSTVLVEEVSVTSAGGKVTKENTTMNLKSGNLVAMLDPKKKAVNNYQVRTPKGVAAARGTTFVVSMRGQQHTVAVINGVVSFSGPGFTGEVGAGQVSVNGPVISMAQYIGMGGARSALISELVASIAVAAENNIGGTTSADLKAVVDAVIAAAPELAAQIASAVQQYAPSQSSVIQQSVQENASGQSTAVQQAIQNPTITTPQVIDPSTVSRSNE